MNTGNITAELIYVYISRIGASQGSCRFHFFMKTLGLLFSKRKKITEISARSSFPFCTHQCSQLPQIVHVYSKLFPLLVSFVSGCTDFVSCSFLHHATAHTMTLIMMNYNYLSRKICFEILMFYEFHCTHLISSKCVHSQ